MHLFLAGHVTAGRETVYPTITNRLESYAYPRECVETLPVLPAGARVIIDSGAFTAKQTGRVFTVPEYAEWALQVQAQHAARFSAFDFMSLDVIGDQEATWRQFDELRALGLHCLPIITGGCDVRDIDRALEHPYVACGNLTGGLGRGKGALTTWLDILFARVAARVKAGHPLPRLHLLGMTSEDLLLRYPAFSADSSSWTGLARFGNARGTNVKAVPSRKSDEGKKIHALLHRREIEWYQSIEKRVTAHWARRGITWQD